MRRLAVVLMTVAVIALTRTAFAGEPPPPPADATAANAAAPPAPTSAPVSTGTPLHLRSSSVTSPDSSSGGSLWKLAAIAAIIGGAAWYMRKKRAALGAKADGPTRAIQVISRASVGVRTELVVVDVDGTTLLLGVTPASVTRLAILGTEGATKQDSAEHEEEAPAIPERFGALLEGLKKTTSAPRLVVADEPAPVEPQARGLLALRKR